MLIDKFKERSPVETIEIIQNFYRQRQCVPHLVLNNQSECSTWWSKVDVYFQDELICSTNGKGTTELFSLASAYAESYERFCNRIQIYSSPIISKRLLDMNKIKYQYYINKDEILNQKTNDNFLDILKHYFNNNQYLINCYLDIITNNQQINIPYKSIFSNQEIFCDPRILTHLNKSVGMCAGNTLEEALNQGISEICEHYVDTLYFLKNNIKTYYIIDNIPKSLLSYIQEIKKLNYEIYIIDFSYNFNLPVIGALLINNHTYNAYLNFGSFPIIDIAIERCITELYQGIISYNGIYPEGTAHNITGIPQFQNFLQKIQFKNYNQDIFLNNNNINNKDLLQYWKKFNYNFYYYDNSLSKDMYALQVICPDLIFSEDKGCLLEHLKVNKMFLLNILQDLYNIHDYILTDNVQQILNIINQLQNTHFSQQDNIFIGNLINHDWQNLYIIYKEKFLLNDILKLFKNLPLDHRNLSSTNSVIKQNLLKYNLLLTNPQILLNFQEDIGKLDINNKKQMLYDILIYPYQQIWNSKKYEQFLTLFLPYE